MTWRTSRVGWIARPIAAPIVLLFGVFFVGEGVFGPERNWQAQLATTEWLRLAPMGLALVGLLAAFPRPRLGGAVAVLAMVGWLVVEHLTGPRAPKMPELDLWPFYLVLMAGVLFWLSAPREGAGSVAAVP